MCGIGSRPCTGCSCHLLFTALHRSSSFFSVLVLLPYSGLFLPVLLHSLPHSLPFSTIPSCSLSQSLLFSPVLACSCLSFSVLTPSSPIIPRSSVLPYFYPFIPPLQCSVIFPFNNLSLPFLASPRSCSLFSRFCCCRVSLRHVIQLFTISRFTSCQVPP